jgi:hypothetical protein
MVATDGGKRKESSALFGLVVLLVTTVVFRFFLSFLLLMVQLYMLTVDFLLFLRGGGTVSQSKEKVNADMQIKLLFLE